MEKVTNSQRSAKLSNAVANYVAKGYKLVDKNDVAFTAVLHRDAQKTNHILHLLLTLVTCFIWLLIWGLISLTRDEASTVNLYVDEFGNLINK
ncbi:hypothetical protein VO54_01527 [Elizabethkingia miricola]|nr:hypothetical protein VO54_01527 [Elizabethkingia miricola]